LGDLYTDKNNYIFIHTQKPGVFSPQVGAQAEMFAADDDGLKYLSHVSDNNITRVNKAKRPPPSVGHGVGIQWRSKIQ